MLHFLSTKLANRFGVSWYFNLPFKHEQGDILVARYELDHNDAQEIEGVVALGRLFLGKDKLDWLEARDYKLKVFAHEDRESFQVVFYLALNLTPEQATEYHLYWTQGT